MRTLVSFSGGLDSTYVLWKLLTTTEDEVTACFLDARYVTEDNAGGLAIPAHRHLYQEICADNVVNWLKANTRPFNFYKKNIYSMQDDEILVVWFARYAAGLANENKYDRFITGAHPSANAPNGGLRARVEHGEFNKLAKRGSYEHPLTIYGDDDLVVVPPWRLDISQQMVETPSALQDLTVSCLNATSGEGTQIVSCGTCFKCLRNKFVRSRLSEGATPSVVYEEINTLASQLEHMRVISESAGRKKLANTATWLSYKT